MKTFKHVSNGNIVDPEEVAAITTEPYGFADEETGEPTVNYAVVVILKCGVVIQVGDDFSSIEQASAYALSVSQDLNKLH